MGYSLYLMKILKNKCLVSYIYVDCFIVFIPLKFIPPCIFLHTVLNISQRVTSPKLASNFESISIYFRKWLCCSLSTTYNV